MLELNRTLKAGVAWMAVERGAVRLVNLVGTVILARLLTPDDFGVVGIAVLFTGLSTRLFQFGLGLALIQRQTIRPDHIASLFVMSLIINGLIWLGLTSASPFIGAYFNNRLVGDVVTVLSWNFLIRCLGVCPAALLQRQMKFRTLTVGVVIDAAAKTLVAIALGSRGFGVWSLVYAELSAALIQKIYLIVASGWRPSLRATRSATADLFGFGMGISLKGTFIHLFDNADNFVVGKLLGTSSLGFYERAYRLMNLPVAEFTARMNTVLFPAFARIHVEPGRLRAAFRKTVLSLSLLGYPTFASLTVLAPQTIDIVYGPRWASIVVPFQILCLVGMPRILIQVISSLVNATGSVNPEAWRRMAGFCLLSIGCVAGTRWGIVGVATAVAIVNLLMVIALVRLLTRVCAVSVTDVLRPQLLPLLGTITLAGVEKGCQFWTSQVLGLNVFEVLGTSLFAGCAAYTVVLYSLRDGSLKALIEEVTGDVRPLARARALRRRETAPVARRWDESGARGVDR